MTRGSLCHKTDEDLYFSTATDTDVAPLRWLYNCPLYPKIYFEKRSDPHPSIGAGKLKEIKTLYPLPHDDLSVFSINPFPSALQDPIWKGMERNKLWIPTLEMFHQNNWKIAQNTHTDHFEPISFPLPPMPIQEIAQVKKKEHFPNFNDWKHLVDRALCGIEQKKFKKIVLARKTTLALDKPLCPYQVLLQLKELSKNSYFFLYQISPHKTFLGASPERLYLRNNQELLTEAIAGTRKSSSDFIEDNRLAQELLHSKKDNEEVHWISTFLQKELFPYCNTIEAPVAPKICKTPFVQHLQIPFKAQLHPNCDELSFLQALHPTPATGGYPKTESLKHLLEIEPFQRGLFASSIGTIQNKHSDLCVAIRSALCEPMKIHLFAGVGIVADSDPIKEWEELEAKISQFTHGVFNA